MDMLGPGSGKQTSLFGGIVAIDSCAVHIAFGKPHDFAGLEINGGKYDHLKKSVSGEPVEPRLSDKKHPSTSSGLTAFSLFMVSTPEND